MGMRTDQSNRAEEGTERFGVNERTELILPIARLDGYSDGRRRAAFREQI